MKQSIFASIGLFALTWANGDFAILNGLEELLYEPQSAKCRYTKSKLWFLNAPNPSFYPMTTFRFCAVPRLLLTAFFIVGGIFSPRVVHFGAKMELENRDGKA